MFTSAALIQFVFSAVAFNNSRTRALWRSSIIMPFLAFKTHNKCSPAGAPQMSNFMWVHLKNGMEVDLIKMAT
jgi:hypothetical protein